MNYFTLGLIYFIIVTWFKYLNKDNPIKGRSLRIIGFFVAIVLALIWTYWNSFGSFIKYITYIGSLWILPYGLYLLIRYTVIPLINDLFHSIIHPFKR